jgi:hypothetical protein
VDFRSFQNFQNRIIHIDNNWEVFAGKSITIKLPSEGSFKRYATVAACRHRYGVSSFLLLRGFVTALQYLAAVAADITTFIL